MTISSVAKAAALPYSTANGIINGKVDINRVQVGIARSLAAACGVSFDELYEMCTNREEIPHFAEGKVIIRNKKYYLDYHFGGREGTSYLLDVNQVNKRFVRDVAEWEIADIYDDIRREETEHWAADDITS